MGRDRGRTGGSPALIPIYQGQSAWDWLQRQGERAPDPELSQRVGELIRQVQSQGDAALQTLARRFGDPAPGELSWGECQELSMQLPDPQRQALEYAARNIARFAGAAMAALRPVELSSPGFRAGLELRPVQRVACYAPAGRHPLPSTVLMTGLAARAAGVEQICLACPRPDPAVVVAAELAGLHPIYRMGGAQAVAALAYGTQTVRPVDMLVGPGNAYVTEAKRQLQGVIGIDMLAGPSEVTIIADGGADPHWLALDLLAQAEHDPDARVVLLTWEAGLCQQVHSHLAQAIQQGRYPEFFATSLACSALIHLEDAAQCVQAANSLAPEHLQLAVAEPHSLRSDLKNYGGLFLGYASTVPFGDYGAGPNHTLPTAGTARFAAGLSPLTFLRAQCWLEVGSECQELAANTAVLADLEGLHGHAAAARARLGH